MMTTIVMSFMSSFSNRDSQNGSPQPSSAQNKSDSFRNEQENRGQTASPPVPPQHASDMGTGESPQPRTQRERAPSRPMSMVQTYQPALMDVTQDTLPELQPIFTFLNSHSNKLYQEGYFLKLDDQNTRMSPMLLTFQFLTILQRDEQMRIEPGQNVSLNLLEQSCHCGMPRNWMQLVKMAKFCQNSSTSQMPLSKW
jgi:hypothetical protein